MGLPWMRRERGGTYMDVRGGPGPCFSRVKLNQTTLNKAVCKVSKPINIRTYVRTYIDLGTVIKTTSYLFLTCERMHGIRKRQALLLVTVSCNALLVSSLLISVP